MYSHVEFGHSRRVRLGTRLIVAANTDMMALAGFDSGKRLAMQPTAFKLWPDVSAFSNLEALPVGWDMQLPVGRKPISWCGSFVSKSIDQDSDVRSISPSPMEAGSRRRKKDMH